MDDEVKTFTQEQVNEMIAAKLNEETTGLKSKVDELLGEKKSAQAKATESEALRKQQEELALKEKGEYETLYGSANEELTNLKAQVASDREKANQNTIKSFAAQLAGDVSGGLGAQAIEDATNILSSSVQINDDGQPVFTVGGIQVDVETMKKQFTESRSYLVAGSGSTGGGATQSTGTGGAGGNKGWSKMSIKEKTQHLTN